MQQQPPKAPVKAMRRRRPSSTASTTSTSSNLSASSSAGSRVSFGSVQVREYNRIAGDHPEVSEGPSMSLGWGYVERKPQSVNKFEKNQDRASQLMPLSGETRIFILSFVFNIPPADIKRSENIAMRVQTQRQETNRLHKEQEKKKATKKKDAFEKVTLVVTKESASCLIQDPLPRHLKEGHGASFLRNAARKSIGVFKRLERQ